VWTFAAVIADGAQFTPPEPSVAESTIGLLATMLRDLVVRSVAFAR
jgi:hypothetical protein